LRCIFSRGRSILGIALKRLLAIANSYSLYRCKTLIFHEFFIKIDSVERQDRQTDREVGRMKQAAQRVISSLSQAADEIRQEWEESEPSERTVK